MSIPLTQMLAVARYVVKQRLKGSERSPRYLRLEPLFRCNLSCTGCGKIQYPVQILKKHLSVEECVHASDECGAPVVSIAGGEPLLHPQIAEIARELTARKRFVYLCTNALLLERKLHEFQPSPYLSFSVHMDGPRAEHDLSVCREGGYDMAVTGIRAAPARGVPATTHTTLVEGADPRPLR